MQRWPIDNTLSQSCPSLLGERLVITAWITVAGTIAAAASAGSPFASNSDTFAVRALASVEIARAHPGRDSKTPVLPHEALTETERLSEGIEPGVESAYSWPAGISAGRCSAHDSAGGVSAVFVTNAVARVRSVDLLRLCRLLI